MKIFSKINYGGKKAVKLERKVFIVRTKVPTRVLCVKNVPFRGVFRVELHGGINGDQGEVVLVKSHLR